MKTTAKVCQTGGKQLGNRYVNEDTIRYGKGYSFLMDGATGLGGPESINGLTSAEWYIQKMASFLEKELQNKETDLIDIVTKIIELGAGEIRAYEKANSMKFESYEEPSSSLVIRRDIEKEGTKKIQIYILRRF